MNEWLKDIKVGDEVLVGDYTVSPHVMKRVKRLTRTQIILESGSRYNRQTGRNVGASTPWSRSYLTEVTPKRLEVMERQELVVKLSSMVWKRYGLKVLRQVMEVLQPTGSKNSTQ